MKNKFLLYFALLVIAFEANAQMKSNDYNLSDFSDTAYQISDEIRSLTPDEYESHPEFGKIPYNAPCDNCYELIHKRTDSTKMFVEMGSHGRHYYSQSSMGKIHYTNDDNQMMTFDPRLKRVNSELYISKKQESPTFLNIGDNTAGFQIAQDLKLKFGHYKLVLNHTDGSTANLGVADWSNYSIGEDGIRISNAWQGIDIEFIFKRGEIKSNIVIEEPLNNMSDVVSLEFIEDFALPVNYSFVQGNTDSTLSNGSFFGEINIVNQNNITKFKISKGVFSDASGIKENTQKLFYNFNSSSLTFKIPASWLSAPSREYPIKIDPAVNSTAAYGNFIDFRYDGDFCGGPNGACTYNLSVPRPPNSTLTNATFTSVYNTAIGGCFYSCWMSEAGFQIVGPCGISPTPTTYWTCVSPGGDTWGTCSSINVNLFQTVSCLSPSCGGDVDFTMRTSYCYCDYGAGCPISCHYINPGDFSVTLEGHTLETLGDQITGNGSTTMSPATCSGNITLDPNTQNGVPGYSYSWDNGSTSPTISIDPYIYNGQTVEVDVTDACGVTRTASFVINCPLGNIISSFSAERWDDQVKTFWTTENVSNVAYYVVQRSKDGDEYQNIGRIKAQGQKHYDFIDDEPIPGVQYYRLLAQTSDDESFYSNPVSILFEGSYPIKVVPNPVVANGFRLEFSAAKDYPSAIRITDTRGNQVYQSKVNVQKGMNTFTLSPDLKKGMYIISVNSGLQILKTRFAQQ